MLTLARRRGALLACLALAACSGITARQKVMLPAMARAWTSIAEEVTDGINANVAKGNLSANAGKDLEVARDAMAAALTSGEPASIAAARWGDLKAQASDGIDAAILKGTVSVAASQSLTARIRQFDADLQTYLERQ